LGSLRPAPQTLTRESSGLHAGRDDAQQFNEIGLDAADPKGAPMEPYAAIFVLGIVGLLMIAKLGLSRRTTRSFRCPITCNKVTAQFEQAIFGGRLLDVERCSAFSDAVTCKKTCLRTESKTNR
jgi:hypothetical protein